MREKILVIDDSTIDRMVLEEILKNNDYEVFLASDGREGLNLFKKNPVDLVITDMVMPGKMGIDVILELKENYPDLKIIAMSAGGEFGPEVELDMAHIYGALTITKPFDPEQVLEAVNKYLSPVSEKGDMTLLIIDDSEIDLEILEAMLKQLGFNKIAKASNGMDGIKRAQELLPSIIFLDIVMPVLDGGETAERLRGNSTTNEIPIVYASSIVTTNEVKRLRGLLRSEDSLIAKPYSINEISKATDYVLGKTPDR